MGAVDDDSVSLVVTSPPYPMIELWDAQFGNADAVDRGCTGVRGRRPGVRLDAPPARFGMARVSPGAPTRRAGMHQHRRRHAQDRRRVPAVLQPQPHPPGAGQTRILDPAGYPVAQTDQRSEQVPWLRHAAGRCLRHLRTRVHPDRTQGRSTRKFSPADKARRRRSAFFWEERNVWFSDLWLDLVGARQILSDAGFDDPDARARSAAYPFELAYRLIQMYSLIGDTVLDPFLGTGTTTAASIASGRSSIGYEIESSLAQPIHHTIETAVPLGREYAQRRLVAHLDFVQSREEAGRPCRHVNRHYGFPVVTGQEVDLQLLIPDEISLDAAGHCSAKHEPAPRPVRESQPEFSFGSAS